MRVFSWEKLREKLKDEQGRNPSYKSLLDSVVFMDQKTSSQDTADYTFSVPSALHHKQVQKYLIKDLEKNIPGAKIIFEIKKSASLEKDEDFSQSSYSSQELKQGSKAGSSSAQGKFRQKLNPHYTFNRFVQGPENEFALSVCKNLSSHPSNLFKGQGVNPLFIYGASGLGKTHLLSAFGHSIQEQFPHLEVLYTSGDSFFNQCVSAFRYNKILSFRERLQQSCDVLLMDDVQALEKGDSVQEQFFYTLNSFLESGKQVVVASDRMPKDLAKLKDRIKTRFESGVIADVKMPGIETRVAILKNKVENKNLLVPDGVIEYVADISRTSIRELEGNLNKVKMYAELQGVGISLELAKSILASHENIRVLTVEEIQRYVSGHYNISLQEIKSKSRKKEFLFPRQVSMYITKVLLDKSSTAIGRAFGGRDHSTVLSSIEKIKKFKKEDANFERELENIASRIKGSFHV